MAKKKTVSISDLDGESVLDTVSLDAPVAVEDNIQFGSLEQAIEFGRDVLVAQAGNSQTSELPEFNKEHCPTDPDWTEYVLSKLSPDELSPEGRPTCDGLRRVAELVLGVTINSSVRIIQAPGPDNAMTAVAEFSYTYESIHTNREVTFTAAADCNSGNTDGMFSRFATAMAETRAEGRALRKALRLRRIITAEEPSALFHDVDLSNGGKSTEMQHSFIQTLCSRNDINIDAYLGSSKSFKWDGKLENIPHKSAVLIIAHLNELQRDRSKIDPKFKGYDSDWKKNSNQE
jgi:hypothetical protein